MIKLAIFDCDMAIVNSSYAIMEAFYYIAEREGLPKASHELTMQYIAAPIATVCEGLLGEYRPEWIKMYRIFMEERESELIKPFEDTIPTLKNLQEMGIKCAVASNRERPRIILEKIGISKYFSEIVGAVEPYGKLPYKPNSAMIDELLKHMNISKENAVYIGDADIDILTAMNAGVRSVGITTGNFTAEELKMLGAWKVINSLSEIIEIVKKDAAC